jgi:hypothetical protein
MTETRRLDSDASTGSQRMPRRRPGRCRRARRHAGPPMRGDPPGHRARHASWHWIARTRLGRRLPVRRTRDARWQALERGPRAAGSGWAGRGPRRAGGRRGGARSAEGVRGPGAMCGWGGGGREGGVVEQSCGGVGAHAPSPSEGSHVPRSRLTPCLGSTVPAAARATRGRARGGRAAGKSIREGRRPHNGHHRERGSGPPGGGGCGGKTVEDRWHPQSLQWVTAPPDEKSARATRARARVRIGFAPPCAARQKGARRRGRHGAARLAAIVGLGAGCALRAYKLHADGASRRAVPNRKERRVQIKRWRPAELASGVRGGGGGARARGAPERKPQIAAPRRGGGPRAMRAARGGAARRARAKRGGPSQGARGAAPRGGPRGDSAAGPCRATAAPQRGRPLQGDRGAACRSTAFRIVTSPSWRDTGHTRWKASASYSLRGRAVLGWGGGLVFCGEEGGVRGRGRGRVAQGPADSREGRPRARAPRAAGDQSSHAEHRHAGVGEGAVELALPEARARLVDREVDLARQLAGLQGVVLFCGVGGGRGGGGGSGLWEAWGRGRGASRGAQRRAAAARRDYGAARGGGKGGPAREQRGQAPGEGAGGGEQGAIK